PVLCPSPCQDEKEQLIQSKSSVASLVGRSKSIVQLRPRNPEHLVKSTIPIKAVCDYRQIEITICRNDECVLEDNSQRTKWKVISPTGNEAMVPSVCFLIPPPNKEAIEMANRVEQLYQKVMALWHQLHMNTKSLISWNYLRKDIALVQSFSMEKLRSLAQGECQQALRSLQAHYEDFLQDSRDSELFSVSDRLRLEEEVESSKEHIQQLLESMENEDKDETVARTYLSELQNIRLRLEECEQRLVGRIQSPSSSRADGDSIQENTIRIAEQERTQDDLQRLKSDLRCVSERCCSFLSKAPSGPSTPRLRAELDLLVTKMEQTYGLSSVYLDKLKTVDIIIRNTQGAESLVKGYEVKLSQEEAVPADLTAIQAHRSALQQWLGEVKGKNSVFSVLEEEMAKAKAVGERLYQLRQERSIDLERYQEKGSQLWDRWQRACAQIETRHTELESIQEVLSDYRQCHRALIQWIEEITAQQELMKPGQAEDSRVLSEQLSQQTALAAEIEKNQAKLDQCQKFSQQYSAAVKDYELQLMTYRAFVESQQKSPMKRRRMLSSSDAITQEFMDLRTRYTALVTLTTQHVKYISDALRRLEEEEKVVEEEKQEHVDKVKELLGWAVGLKQSVQGRTAAARSRELGDIEKSISEQQALNEELAAKKEQVSEAIKTSQIFLAKHNHKLSHQEKDQISAQVAALKDTYQALCTDTTEQLQQLQSQLAQEAEHKVSEAVAGVIDLGTVEIFPVFGAMQRGLIDQETGLVLLEAQVITSDLVLPETGEKLSLEEGLARDIINLRTFHVLRELKDALQQVHEVRREGRQLLPAAAAVEEGRISESTGLKILEVELVTGGFKTHQGRISMQKAVQERLLPPQLYSRLLSHLESNKDLIDPNTAEKINLSELLQRCILHQDTGLRFLPVKQLAGGMVSLKSGRKVSIFRAVQEGLIDRQVTVRLLEAQLFAGGIVDPRTGHRLAVDEAVRHNLIDQDLACTLLIRQLQTGGIIDAATGERLTVDEAVRKELVAPRLALVILESLRSFMGLLWPETGEVVPAAGALEQGILSTELAYKILRKRQLIKAVFIPETTEVLSWKKAVEHGILERDVAKKLKSMVIPDVMGSVQLASRSSSGGHQGQRDPELRGDDEKLMFHLMTHSYINIHDGQKLLLVDGELSNLTKDLIQTQENGSCAHPLEEDESFEETKETAVLESEPCNGVAVQQLELQLAPLQEGSKKTLPPRSTLENGEVGMGPGRLLLDRAGDDLHVEEQGQVCTERATTRSETDARSGREQIASTGKEKHQVKLSMPGQPCKSGSGFRETEEMIIKAEESKPIAADGLEDIKDQKRALETGAGVVKSESHLVVPICASRERLEVVAGRSGGAKEPELEAEGVGEIYFWNEETAQNGTLGGEEAVLTRTAEAEQMECTENTASVLHVEEGPREKVLGGESVGDAALPRPSDRDGDVLETLQMQLQSGGILCEQMGRTLLLNEAVACGAVPGHTAVKLMEKMKMFSGFFDSHTRESLTTEDVIEEGLMDEQLLQKVLTSDKAISGVLDPGNNFVYSVKDAAAVGLLDRETAMRLLEGQVVTGGIVDLKRGKKVSVTLASNLGLIEPASQKELVKLEKASKGKSTDEATRQKLLRLQAETSGIVDPKTKQPLTVAQAVERGLLEREKAFQLLTRQIAGGGILHHASGMRLSVSDAMKHDLIDADLCNELTKAEGVCLQECTHPVTKEKLPLPRAVAAGVVSPEFQRKVQEIQAGAGSVIDPSSGQRMALSRAAQEGLLPQEVVQKALSSPELKHGIVDPESCVVVPYAEMVKKCRIDVESGQRYLEVHPFRAVRDEASGRALSCAEALRLGRADPLPTLRLLQGQADSGGFVEGAVSSRLSLQAALQRGLERAGSTGAGGTAASPAEGVRTAQRRALLGSSGPPGGTISDIYISGESGDMSAKEKLLLWTQKVTAGYIGVKCTNFSSCWSDGKMFNALIHRYRPDLVDMERVQVQSNRENLEQAFEIAERLGVTRLLDAEDVDVPSPDEKSVITYVSSIYDAFPKVPEGGEGISAIEVDSRWLEYQTRLESLISWIKQHTILMSDKSFPQNPVELKALYNQYIHFKETEIPAREQEKGRIEELYKLLEVWIEFGRIKLPQGYHPNDVEEEWGKLIIEMLEREKLLRPAVERLELLLQIANKIQNGALSCEEKLTLAKNTLQADAAHLEAGQPVQYEADVVVYLQECEGLLRQLQVDVQILRDENYYQLEELAFRIMRLQDELVTLRLECTNLYRKGHFSTLELAPAPTLSTTQLKGESLTKGLHTSSASWFRKPMTRTELVAISSSEDEGSLRFVYELLAWVEEMQMRLERAEWGSDLPSVETQLETQQHIHSSVEELGSNVKEARLYEGKMSQNFRASYTETLGKLETQYCKLMETSSFRLRHLQSLHGFVSQATAELIWLNEKEEEELAYDWSDNNPNIAAKRNYFSELTMELEEKQDIFRSLQDTAELLALENHPAKQTVEAYSAAVQSQWQWIKQLCLCVEQHVKENAAYFQFFSDARESEAYLRNLQDSIRRKYSCDHSTSLPRLEDLLQDSMGRRTQSVCVEAGSFFVTLSYLTS
ncbi:microtubule-actin cross-linking factor 1, isoforms 1/2/3/5, partial [Meleagris gallopavo]|uniref:microtubule-actin cross-linking factor 1, isoforms 1/2/3/5 n=1 Tax=Meleagris gallopavo TaxID=9103 RepID=UPI00093EE047